MYKTVRQGENSLQYHILPQDDGGHVMKRLLPQDDSGHVMKRRRSSRNRTAFILVITLILGCAIVAAAVLIPVLLTSNVVALPARFQTFAVAASSVSGLHGKYTLQGAQYIALLPVKDAMGHFNAYQLKPSVFTTTSTTTTSTTTTTTTTEAPTTTTSTTTAPAPVFRIGAPQSGSSLVGVRTENNDPYRPLNSSVVKRGEIHRPRWMPDPYMPWMEHKSGALVLSLGVGLVMLLAIAALGLCLYLRRRAFSTRRDVERDKGTLLAEVSGDED